MASRILRSPTAIALLLVLVSTLTACGTTGVGLPTDTGPTVLEPNAVVIRAVDGDTVDLRVGKRRERVRLIGINTPETVDPRKPVECFGPEAKQETKHLLPSGTRVRVERDLEPRDDYGRLLVYVYRASDGLFVNLKLVNSGLAVPLRIAPNTAHAAEFAAAATAAERASLGLWSACPR